MKILFKSFVGAILLEFVILFFLVNLFFKNTISQSQIPLPPEQMLEANLFEWPKPQIKKVHLADSKSKMHAVPKEKAINPQVVSSSNVSHEVPHETQEEKNITLHETDPPANHGPIAYYTPAPAIPVVLQNESLNVSVVVEFSIKASGELSVRLAHSSGNGELDAVALRTAKTWQFHPAEKNRQMVDSVVRLRIDFEVSE